MSSSNSFEKLTLPTFSDPRGSLTVLDKLDELVDWPVKRSYWQTYVTANRGAHCVKGEKKFYVMAQGTCKVKLFDGKNWHQIDLKGPSDVLWFKDDLWREFEDFSEGAVIFTLCNMHYEKDKYILDLQEFENYMLSR